MTGLKTMTAAVLLSMIAVGTANAQLPNWANSEPESFEAQYPNRDVLNGGALTPAGRMGVELLGRATPVYTAHAHAGTGNARSPFCGQHYRSYDAAAGIFLGYDGSHQCQ